MFELMTSFGSAVVSKSIVVSKAVRRVVRGPMIIALGMVVFGPHGTLMAAPESAATTAEAPAEEEKATGEKVAEAAPAPASDTHSESSRSALSAIDDTQSPEQLIEKATNLLVKELLIGSKLEKEQQPEYYRRAVEDIVAPLIDFKRIARRVMSKHYKLATSEQREAFAVVFRESLVDTYTMGITGYSDEEIKMLPFKGIKVSKKSKIERAKVEMEIRTKEGDVLPVVYQVYKNKSGQWRLENMILSGVNLGLTYRNQFNESLKSEKGNLDNVIQKWNVSTVVETKEAS